MLENFVHTYFLKLCSKLIFFKLFLALHLMAALLQISSFFWQDASRVKFFSCKWLDRIDSGNNDVRMMNKYHWCIVPTVFNLFDQNVLELYIYVKLLITFEKCKCRFNFFQFYIILLLLYVKYKI